MTAAAMKGRSPTTTRENHSHSLAGRVCIFRKQLLYESVGAFIPSETGRGQL